MEIECCPDTNQDRSRKPLPVSGHPQFLFRRAETYPDNIGRRRIDLSDYCVLFDSAGGPKRRRVAAHDSGDRKLPFEIALEEFESRCGCAIKKMLIPGVLRFVKQSQHQIRSVDTLAEFKPSLPL